MGGFSINTRVLFLLMSLLTSSSCLHPMTRGRVKQDLREVERFDYARQLRKKPVPLKEAPLEPDSEVYRRVGNIFSRTDVKADEASDTVQMTLADVKRFAIENNLGLRAERYGPELSEEEFTAEKWKFEPILGASANLTEDNGSSEPTGTPGATTLLIEPSIAIPNHLGGQVTLSVPYRFIETELIGIQNVDSPGFTVALQQPLLRNAWLKVNYASINIAGLRARQADAQMKLATIRTVANAEQSYWRYFAAYEGLRIQNKKYELAKEQLRFAKRLVEEGVRKGVEVTRAAAGVAREFEGVIRAELLRRQTERALKRVMNLAELPVESTTAIQPATPPRPVGLVFDRPKVLAIGLEKRMELFDIELQLAIDQTNMDFNWNLQLPDVSVSFSYSFRGERNPSEIFSDEFNSSSLGVMLDFPLAFNQSAQARYRRSALTRQQTLVFQENQRLLVREEVLNAVDGVEYTWQQVLANRRAMALARETYEAEKVQFGYGTITSRDLLLALDQLASAELAYIGAVSDYQNALVDLAFATGTILDESGVVWPELKRAGGE